ncbi:MAG TPA: hypothetical protein VK993_09450, partial [Chthoniobacterales bacterium]|nr:hypothetical protein [Chthoniobacterales bacterium]
MNRSRYSTPGHKWPAALLRDRQARLDYRINTALHIRHLLLVLCVICSTPTEAQPPAPAAPQERIVIHAGALLDRPGREPRRNATVVVQNGRIASVQDGFAEPPAGARVIDLRDRFVLPGLIDSHVHLDSDRAGIEGQLASVTDSAAM